MRQTPSDPDGAEGAPCLGHRQGGGGKHQFARTAARPRNTGHAQRLSVNLTIEPGPQLPASSWVEDAEIKGQGRRENEAQ